MPRDRAKSPRPTPVFPTAPARPRRRGRVDGSGHPLGAAVACRNETRPFVAVLSRERSFVNVHLGDAVRVFVFGRRQEGYQLVDTRMLRSDVARAGLWFGIANALSDCRALLVVGASESARAALSSFGLDVIVTQGHIEDALDAVYDRWSARRPRRSSSW
jgi:nitrogen fixation protein NifB